MEQDGSEMLLRQSRDCAWLLERDGTIHAIYGDAPRVFGRSTAELEGGRFIDLFAAAARPCWTGRVERVFAGETLGAAGNFGAGSTFSITMFPVRAGDGEIVFAGGMAHQMPEGGRVLRTLAGLETERTKLAHLLHDHIGQNLSAAGLQLDLLRMDLADDALPVPRRIGEIQEILESLIGMVREVNREFYPSTADRVGLRAALDGLGGRLRETFKGTVRVFADSKAQPSPEAAAAMYRIAQEAAAMAAGRAGCTAIEILVTSPRGGVALEIRDNGGAGDGAGECLQGGGLEFLVMQHFADQAGIELHIESKPDGGMAVRAIWKPGETSGRRSAGG